MKDTELTISVPEAGRRVGIGRSGAYEAVRRGELPTLRFGRLLRVPVAALNRMLESAHCAMNETDRQGPDRQPIVRPELQQ